MHRVELPTTKRAGLPLYISAALLLLAMLWLPGGACAQWTTPDASNNIHNTNSSNVGVGTGSNAPASRLEVVNPAGGYVSGNYFQVTGTTADNNNYPGVQLKGGAWATEYPQFKLGNAGLAAFLWGGRSATYTNRMGLMLSSEANGNAYASVQKFDGTNTTDLFVVRDSGKVGIGTTTPADALHVAISNANTTFPNSLAGIVVQNTSNTNNNYSGVFFQNSAGGGDVAFGAVHLDAAATGASRRGAFVIGTAGTAAGGVVERLRVDDNGNLGVGTSSPLQRLDVSGAVGLGPAGAGYDVLNIVPGTAAVGQTTSIKAFNSNSLQLTTYNTGTLTYNSGVTIDTAGNVGVGAAPNSQYRLYVNGSINAVYQDVAEWVPSSQKLAAGTVVVLDTKQTNHVLASTKAYDTAVAGVVSDTPGVILGQGGADKVKVATTGRVRVRVDATRAPIRVGDLLVTSEVEGVAMKSVPVDLGGVQIHRPGTIIGKALEPLDKGTGEILVLLSLQ